MIMTLETIQPINSNESLEKVLNFLMTPTIHNEIEHLSTHLSFSKGAGWTMSTRLNMKNWSVSKRKKQ